MSKYRGHLVFLLSILCILSLGFPAAISVQETPGTKSAIQDGEAGDDLKQFEQLIKKGKYEPAAALIEKMLIIARAKKDNNEWTRCLIRIAQLRISLHGYETAVRFLKDQPWPEDLMSVSVLNLFYAQALTTYSRAHSWEISKREKIDSKEEVDLKTWTHDQIYTEALRAYGNVWKIRAKLGELPNSQWKEYINPNNYPTGIRPTLRDSVSYLSVEMLSDTNRWRPDQLNESFRLNIKSLIDGNVGEISLTDAYRHPMEKVCYILADLENWHAGRGEQEAVLEARLERYRELYDLFDNAEDRKLIRQDLEKHLLQHTDIAWWAEGMAQLAEFIRRGNEPDSLIQARHIAMLGNAAFPDSTGGNHCLSITQEIEAPDYELNGIENDNPQKKSVLVTHKNLARVFFRAFPIDILELIKTSTSYNLLPSVSELDEILDNTSPSDQWDVPLPATPDYRMHRTFVVPPMKKTGAYLIVASARPGFPKADNRLLGLYIVLCDLVLVTREVNGDAEVTVLLGSTGKPVNGVEVMLFRFEWRGGHQFVESKLSNEHGIVQFQARQVHSSYFVFARMGGQIAFDPQERYLSKEPPEERYSTTLFFTDRSIYRPSQKIYWKAVAYERWPNQDRFETSPGTTLTVSLKDANHQTIETKTVTTNSYGTTSGEFFIPTGKALGQWRLESSIEGEADVQVEEYKRPTFEVKILDPQEPLRFNRPAHLKGEARYYFGLPVAGGQVKWLVRREPVFPQWWTYYWWGNERPYLSGSQIVASGISSLNADGTFPLTFSPEIEERLGGNKDITYQYSVSADVTDEGGETRFAKRSFGVGFVSVKASAVLQKSFFLKGDPIKIDILRTNLDDIPKAGKASWRIVSLKGPSEALLPAQQPVFMPQEFKAKIGYRTPGDLERARWKHSYYPEAVLLQWEEGSTKASGSVFHDESGTRQVSIGALAPGPYRLIYETVDDFGAKCELRKNFVVAASSLSLPLPAILELENSLVHAGGKARILVHSGIKDQFVVFEIYRKEKCILRKEMRSGADPSLLEIPITENDQGGLVISMTLVRDNQYIQLQRPLLVPWDTKELKIEFSTFRNKLRPGQTETWSLKVTGPAGKESSVLAAELLAYMYDRSLDTLKSHQPIIPLYEYPYYTDRIPITANLDEIDNIALYSHGFRMGRSAPVFTKDQLIFYGGYGDLRVRHTTGELRELPLVNRNVLDLVHVMSGVVQTAEANGARWPDGINAATRVGPDLIGEFKMVASGPSDKKEKQEVESAEAKKLISAVELRSDFSETAFWQPHLLTGADGSVTFEFKVPDSVTSWNVWIHAITRDFKSGFVNKEARSVKELMVRPYLPRFLREGDQAEIKVVVNNASDKELKGSLNFDIIDVATDQSMLSQFGLSNSDASGKAFTVPASGGTNLTFPIKTPSKVGQIAFKVTATSGDFSDGELRPIPILPGRMHLMQSRFITMKDASKRVMRFDDLARNDDPTRINEQMVVTLDAQLFYSVLSALPYLVNYPYECTEQTLNRFVSTGILSSLYQQYPAIDRMAKEFSSRQTQFEQWDAADPNRKMALEETPWLQMAKGGDSNNSDLINVLDSRIAKAQREAALAKLRQSQTSSGGFPWFSGGPPSPYMTLYILYGFSKALEFGVEVPREIVQPAWNYMHRHYLDDVVRDMVKNDSGWEFVTFINYVLSNYPDSKWYEGTFTPAERKTMLDFSFKHWKSHSPYLKGYLALTLKRMGRPKDAMLVWESVMDSAKTAEDQGTFWAPEDRAWLWYNDTIETHAFAIRTDMELIPQDPKLDGMVLWVFLNKKLNHWKSTRATAEVIYSLAHYLKATGQLGVREDATVTVGNQKTTYVFEPDQYTGKKNQLIIPGEKMDPATASSITVEKTSKGHLFASATWHFSTEQLPEEERGDYLRLTRSYFKRVNTGKDFVLQPLKEGATLAPGDEVEVHLSLMSKHPMEYVHLRDPRGAGFEPSSNLSKHKWDLGLCWYEEIRDSGTNFFFEHVPQGEYTFKYRIRATTAGTFKVAPATVQPMYAPEFAAYSTGATLKISAQ